MIEKSKLKEILEWIYCILIAVVIALLIKYFIATPTVVQMDSMYPTFTQGDRILLNRIPKTFNQMPERGDIITFEAPSKQKYLSAEDVDYKYPVAKYENKQDNIFSAFSYNVLDIGKTSYVKRVIGLPGDHVTIKNGKVYINNEELKEDYLQDNVVTDVTGYFCDIVVPEKTVFAMGDNRSVSMDCRAFGCIPLEKIESKVALRFWPLNKFGTVK